jgi:hypothetical protein
MADGGMNIQLSDYSAAKLAERAKAMGVEPEALAAMLLDDQLFSYDDFTWINGDPREVPVSNDELNEEGRPWSEARPEFVALIETTFTPSE